MLVFECFMADRGRKLLTRDEARRIAENLGTGHVVVRRALWRFGCRG
jgi:hypothetical protein